MRLTIDVIPDERASSTARCTGSSQCNRSAPPLTIAPIAKEINSTANTRPA